MQYYYCSAVQEELCISGMIESNCTVHWKSSGRGKDHSTLQTVEVMNTETLQWSTAADLPQPVFCAPGAICGDRVYIQSLYGRSKSRYTCPVNALLQSCR